MNLIYKKWLLLDLTDSNCFYLLYYSQINYSTKVSWFAHPKKNRVLQRFPGFCILLGDKVRYAQRVAAKKAAEQAERMAILQGTAYELPPQESEGKKIAS